MRVRALFLVLFSLLALWVIPSIGAQDLAASPWYAVLHTKVGDELIWINGSGVQAALPRPKLPNEQAGSEINPSLLISPDGRYAVIRAMLTSGQQGLGIYDFQKGAFVKTHTAQPNETILLGNRYSFMPNSSNIAIGFYTVTDGKVTDWRIIEFVLATGNSKGLLQKSDGRVTEPVTAAGSYPVVFFSPGITQLFAYYFMMVPYDGTGTNPYDALGWSPNGNVIIPLSALDEGFDVLPATTRFIESGVDADQPAAAGEGTIYNVITQRSALTDEPEGLVNDGSASLVSPRWAKNGEWFAYQAVKPDQTVWVVRTLDGATSFTYSGSIPSDLYGTADGYLMNYDGKRFAASTQIDGSAAPVLFEAPRGDEAAVLYVTPQDGAFALPTVAGASPAPVNTSLCDGAPESQVDVHIPVRIINAPLQVRLEPGLNSPVITELAPDTLFVLADGPVCRDGFAWWQMQLAIPGGTLYGWVAEGNVAGYFIAPV